MLLYLLVTGNFIQVTIFFGSPIPQRKYWKVKSRREKILFQTDLIQLRKLSPDDHHIYHNWRNDLDVMCSTSPELDIYTPEETEKFVTAIASQTNARGYMIEYKETGETVGIVSLIQLDHKNRSAQCIIDIGAKNMWGKGIGKAAMALILEYAFHELNLHRVFLQVFSFNERASGSTKKWGL